MSEENRGGEQRPAPFVLKEKIADMMKYGKKAVAMFPRRERKTAEEIQASMLAMYKLAITLEKRYYKKTTLQDLDIELEVLRHLIRLAADKDFYDRQVPKKGADGKTLREENGEAIMIAVQPPLPLKKYEHWSRLLSEIGRIIGGYIKYVNK